MEKLEQPFGKGGEQRVFVHGEDSNRVIKESLEKNIPVEITKAKYYVGKILHLLFPNNLPDIHFVKGGEKEIIQVERVNLDKNSDKLREHTIDKNPSFGDISTNYDIQKEHAVTILNNPQFKNFVSEMGSIGIILDPSAPNWSIDENNNLVYLDSDVLDITYGAINRIDLLDKKIDLLDDEETRQKAKMYLARLKELIKQN